MKIHCRIVRLGVLSFVLMLTLGCGGTKARMGTYNYRVTLDSSLRDPNTNMMPSIEVDFIGANEEESERLISQNIDAYFTPGNLKRADSVRYTMSFTNDRSSAQTLSKGDVIWQTWHGAGAKKMIIFASIQLSNKSNPDPRRLNLTLDRARWAKDGMTIELLIKRTGIDRRTPMEEVRE